MQARLLIRDSASGTPSMEYSSASRYGQGRKGYRSKTEGMGHENNEDGLIGWILSHIWSMCPCHHPGRVFRPFLVITSGN
jgi:hypothetical protein